MFSVRRVKTKSDSTAVQVVRYVGHQAIILKHIGSSKDDTELAVLMLSAANWIEENSAQLSLFADQKQKLLVVDRGECIGVTHHFAYQFFMKCLEECGLSHLPMLLLDLSIMRLVEPVSKLRSIELNTELIEKRRLLLGIKGYCTDLPRQLLSNKMVIERYHQLWHIEQSFRMSKFDLQARPIYHQRDDAIKAHVLICFVALMAEKYLELTTELLLREILYLVWDITETHIQDNMTKEIFSFRSPTKEVLPSSMAPLVSRWNLLPH